MQERNIEVGTDGGCRGNPGPGSWAFVISLNGSTQLKGKSGFSELTTNNEMELTALKEFMLWVSKLSGKSKVTLYIDSGYVLNGYNSWMHNWKRNMWRTSSGSPVKNKQLWHDVYHLSKELEGKVDLTLVKVKGHSGHWLNEAADERCNVMMDEYELNNL